MAQQQPMVHVGSQRLAVGPFAHSTYTIKRPFFTLLGRKFSVFAPDGTQCMHVRHKVLTFKDEWNIYADESETQALVHVKARQAIGLNIITDIFDPQTGTQLGAVRNKGLKSLVRDTWEVLGPGDAPLGIFTEDSNALLRRIFPFLLGRWHMDVQGSEAARVEQVWRFFTKEFTLNIVPGVVDPRFAIACTMLALIREIMREAR